VISIKPYICAICAAIFFAAGIPGVGKDVTGAWTVVLKTEYKDPFKHAGFISDASGFAVMGCCEGQFRHTADGAKTWSEASIQGTLSGLEIVDDKTVWAGGEGTVAVSRDGAGTWCRILNRGKGNYEYLSFINAETGWVASPYELKATTDAGKTWNQIKLPKAGMEISAVCLRTAGEGWLLDSAGMVHHTVDGGGAWSSRALGLNGERLFVVGSPLAAIRFFDASRGTIILSLPSAPSRCLAYQTDNGGQSWKKEIVAEGVIALPRVYLTGDGTMVTLANEKKIVALRHK
jgi:photosystem II stability/assembly factor-like uncharacterized protein